MAGNLEIRKQTNKKCNCSLFFRQRYVRTGHLIFRNMYFVIYFNTLVLKKVLLEILFEQFVLLSSIFYKYLFILEKMSFLK